jgi:Flp pilus assembly protein TadG
MPLYCIIVITSVQQGNSTMATGKIGLKAGGFLARLKRDQSGNVIAMTAAAVLPMIAVIGGAVDMSRIYMTRTRLQAACDAGVLAGRKAMTTLSYPDTPGTAGSPKNRANNMFNYNFKAADYDANGTTFTSSADAQGKITGSASTNLPTVLMKIFGKTTTAINVTCGADLQIPNIDVVMVLDVTGSMNDCPDGDCNSVGEQKKIVSLRAAVKQFFTTLTTAVPAGSASQIRFGFVPYSQAVNGSELFKVTPDATKGQLPLTHLMDVMPVQSRVANFNTPVSGGWIVDSSVTPATYEQRFDKDVAATKQPFVASNTTGTKISNNDCHRWSNDNVSFNIGGINLNVMLYPYEANTWTDNYGVDTFYQPDGSSVWQTSEPTSGTGFTKITTARVSGTWDDDSGATVGDYQYCTRKLTRTKYKPGSGFKFTNWTYKPVNYNVTQYKAGNGLSFVSDIDSDYTVATAGSYDLVQLRNLPDQSGLTADTAWWDGCLEERPSIAQATFTPIPSGAYDLNFLLGGTDDNTRWRPILQDLAWIRPGTAEETTTNDNSRPSYQCPSATMRNLNVMTQTEVNTYADTLQPAGNTYLDVGMIWGLRLIAAQGMFASRNLAGANGGQISRHIIFLTDGEPVSSPTNYSAYAIERLDKRITGSTGVAAATLHSRRFQAMCDSHRGAISIWAIAFGTSVTGNLSACADPDRAFQADNTTELNNAFSNIARDIADLRLVQ